MSTFGHLDLTMKAGFRRPPAGEMARQEGELRNRRPGIALFSVKESRRLPNHMMSVDSAPPTLAQSQIPDSPHLTPIHQGDAHSF
jgi:hypothetical protein